MIQKWNYNLDEAMTIIDNAKLLLVGGNGGSAEQAAHFVAELTGTFENLPLTKPAIAMGCNTAELTAISNDLGYENFFRRYIEVFINFIPAILFISTSGTSKNIAVAIERLQRSYHYDKNIILLTGSGDNVKDTIKESICMITVNSDDTAFIQEEHMRILHELARQIKK